MTRLRSPPLRPHVAGPSDLQGVAGDPMGSHAGLGDLPCPRGRLPIDDNASRLSPTRRMWGQLASAMARQRRSTMDRFTPHRYAVNFERCRHPVMVRRRDACSAKLRPRSSRQPDGGGRRNGGDTARVRLTVAYNVWNISQSCMVAVTKAWATALPTGRGRTAYNPT
jgi:hypothetical protein